MLSNLYLLGQPNFATEIKTALHVDLFQL